MAMAHFTANSGYLWLKNNSYQFAEAAESIGSFVLVPSLNSSSVK